MASRGCGYPGAGGLDGQGRLGRFPPDPFALFELVGSRLRRKCLLDLRGACHPVDFSDFSSQDSILGGFP